MILIAGLGRTGTSFVAECFRTAGVDPGGVWVPQTNAGWEHSPVHHFCLSLIHAGVRFPSCDEAERLLVKHGPELKQLCAEAPRVVKTPLFLPLMELFVHLGVVDRVVYTTRPIDQALQSVKVWGSSSWPYVQKGEEKSHVLDATLAYWDEVVWRHKLSHTTIRFPEMLVPGSADFELLVKEIASVAGIAYKRARSAVQQTIRPKTRRVVEMTKKKMRSGSSKAAVPKPQRLTSKWDKPGVAEFVERRWGMDEERVLRQAIADWVGPGYSASLLDIGCGSARIAPVLDSWEYTGLDNSYELLLLAAERVPSTDLVAHKLPEALPFEDNSFDAVLCVNVLRFLPLYKNVVKVLEEMQRVARRSIYVVDLFIGGDDHRLSVAEVAGVKFANNAWSLPVFLAQAAPWQVEKTVFPPVVGIKIEAP